MKDRKRLIHISLRECNIRKLKMLKATDNLKGLDDVLTKYLPSIPQPTISEPTYQQKIMKKHHEKKQQSIFPRF